jgi:restriction system protein
MRALSKLAIVLVVAMNLAGLHAVTGRAAALAALALAGLLILRRLGVLPLGGPRQAWLRQMLRHRAALTKRFRQVVRVNAYGYEDLGKWHEELARFRRSVGLTLDPKRQAAFEKLATRTVRAWAAAADTQPLTDDIHAMTPEDYEHRCAEILRRAGWGAEVTGQSGDQGVDVVAERAGLTVAIQCKLHFAGPVGNKAVQEVHAAAGFIEAAHAVVVSNGDYTRSAEHLAQKLGVLLLHHSELAGLDALLGRSGRAQPERRRDETLSLAFDGE